MLVVNGHAKHRRSLCRVGYGKAALSMNLKNIAKKRDLSHTLPLAPLGGELRFEMTNTIQTHEFIAKILYRTQVKIRQHTKGFFGVLSVVLLMQYVFPLFAAARATWLNLLEEVIALVINEDECREVLDFNLPYCLHAQFGVFYALNALDVVLGKNSRRTAY